MHGVAHVTFLTNMHCMHHFKHSNSKIPSVASFQIVAMEQVSEAVGKFTVDLFKKLNETNNDKNIFFSPWSISSALALTYLGAKGNTAREIGEVGCSVKLWCPALPSTPVKTWGNAQCSSLGKTIGLYTNALLLLSATAVEGSSALWQACMNADVLGGEQCCPLLLCGIYTCHNFSIPLISHPSRMNYHKE